MKPFGILAILLVVGCSTLLWFNRGLLGQRVPPCLEIADPFHHRYIPGCSGIFRAKGAPPVEYRINSLGMRERELSSLPEKRQRLLLIGDSSVEGHGVAWEDTLSQQLERRLPGWTVINGGIRSSGPILQRLRFERLMNEVKPSAVIWYFTENDFQEDRLHMAIGRSPDRDGIPTEFSTEDFAGTAPSGSGLLRLPPLSWIMDLMRLQTYDHNVRTLLEKVPAESVPTCQALSQVVSRAQNAKVPLRFALIPLGPENKTPYWELGFSRLADCPQVKGQWLDLRPHLNASESFIPGDTHPGPAGVNRMAEETIRRWGGELFDQRKSATKK